MNRWLRQERWAEANIALRPNGWLGIDVDHYDDKRGYDELAALEEKLGPLPATITSTARGQDSPSRIYFFAAPNDRTYRSRLGDSIEIVQRTHRFALVSPSWHPKLGTQYEWYDYEGNAMWGFPAPSEFEALPEAWLNYLTVPDANEHEGFPGPIGEWVKTLAPGEPSSEVRDLVDSLPTDNFTHDDVVRITYRLVALGAEGHSGVPEALARIEQTWVKPPYDTIEYRRELEKAIDGAVKKRGALEVPMLKPMVEVRHLIERSERIDLFIEEQRDPDRFLKEALKELYSLQVSPQDMLSLILGSSSGAKMHPAQVWRAIMDYQPLSTPKPPKEEKFHLITEDERKLVAATPNFVQEYCEVAVLREKRPNLPYHRLNAWMALSLSLSSRGYVVIDGVDRLGLNLNGMILGVSGSGKGMAKSQLRGFLKAVLGEEEFKSINIGGNPSPEALHAALLKRDGGVAWFNTDEADQLLVKLTGQRNSYSDGLQGMLTDYYEGIIPPMLRRGNPEAEQGGTCNLVQWLMGTPSGIIPLLRPQQVETGFLARYLTVFGDPPHIDDESLIPRSSRNEFAMRTGVNPYVRALAEDYKSLFQMRPTRGYNAVNLPDEVLNRIGQANIAMHAHFRGNRNYEQMIRPCLMRISESILKCTALIALSEGRYDAVLTDALIALNAVEEWLGNLLALIDGIQSSEWSQLVDKVWTVIAKRKRIPTYELARTFGELPPRDLTMVIQALKDQKRIVQTKDAHYEVVDGDGDE